MLTPRDARRRRWGLGFLVLAASMLLWGETVFRHRLAGGGYVVYWTVCLALTCLALVVAWLDVRAVRRRVRRAQQELVRQAVGGEEAVRHDGDS